MFSIKLSRFGCAWVVRMHLIQFCFVFCFIWITTVRKYAICPARRTRAPHAPHFSKYLNDLQRCVARTAVLASFAFCVRSTLAGAYVTWNFTYYTRTLFMQCLHTGHYAFLLYWCTKNVFGKISSFFAQFFWIFKQNNKKFKNFLL